MSLAKIKCPLGSSHETRAYNTKLTKKKETLALATQVVDVTQLNLEALARRIAYDLKEDTFEKDAVEAIELTKKVFDVR